MGIIKKTLSVKPERSAVTIIAEGNRFSGDMTVVGKMHIDGSFEGSVVSSSDISIGKRGSVSGTVQAPTVIVSGMLEGELQCELLHIENGGEVRGLVICQKMSIDAEGTFVGERRTPEALVNAPAALPLPQQSAVEDAFALLDSLPDRIVLSDNE
ncbi:bactofilin family protein [Marinobacterium arenosum]|uniref:bactofilin family protein n=1 Tax=Marinobacterium arenosum TaxID=2862496 RepID=UPI001C97409F|nr:polymer-forming cytoskeletal protein [Marinobacterium arenosum]MBY4677889.1 polymer-forming cytoskeletal protein [Marinobacterium arenosum]